MALDPVTGSRFLEREDVLDLLTKRLTAFQQGYRQNMALIGLPGVGKTSLALRFLELAPHPERISIFVEVPQGSLELFIKRFMGGVLRGVLKIKGDEIPWEVTELIQQAKKHIPKTVRHMRAALKLVNLGRSDEAYREVLALPRILREELALKALLVLDNFSNLETLPLRDPFGSFGKEIMIDKDTMYLVASSRPARTRTVFREKLNLLFGNFEILDVSHMDFTFASRFIRKELEGISWSPVQEHFLIQMTDAHPFYLSALLCRIRQILKNEGADFLTDPIIFQAFSDELLKFSGKLHQYFRSLYVSDSVMSMRSKNDSSSLQALAGIALGYRKISSLAKFLVRKITDTKKVLQKLIEEEVIRKEGQIFVLPDTLLRFWLKYVVMISTLGYETDCERRQQYFARQLEIEFGKYESHLAKDLPKRLEELLHDFSGEVISLGTSRVLCPGFQEIHFKPTNGRIFPVFAKSPKGSWLCQVARELVREEDVHVYLDDVKKQSSRICRKVLIALSGIELNAHLMAKASKIAVWDLASLNRLLEVYEKPKVILPNETYLGAVA